MGRIGVCHVIPHTSSEGPSAHRVCRDAGGRAAVRACGCSCHGGGEHHGLHDVRRLHRQRQLHTSEAIGSANLNAAINTSRAEARRDPIRSSFPQVSTSSASRALMKMPISPEISISLPTSRSSATEARSTRNESTASFTSSCTARRLKDTTLRGGYFVANDLENDYPVVDSWAAGCTARAMSRCRIRR